MKKIVLIAIVGIAVIVVGGFLIFQKIGNNSATQPTEQKIVSEENSKEDKGIMDEVLDKIPGLKKGESMKCIYTIKTGEDEFQSETYVEGEKFKSIAVTDLEDETRTYMIFDGETQYNWAEGQSEGFKMSKACAEELGKEFDEYQGEDSSEPNEIAGIDDIFENAVDVNCTPVDKIDFSIPKGINFVDQCQMLKDQMKQLEELEGALPEGFIMPEVQEYD